MRFVVYGAGGVGGVLGARLASAGYEVVLIARGEHLAVIRRDGLRVIDPDGERTHRLAAVGDPGDVDWRGGDVVLLAMKSMDTAAALARLAEVAGPDTPVACVQNGVANEPLALRFFARVYGVCVMFPTTYLVPGVVEANSSPVPGILDLGRFPRGVDPTAVSLAAALRAAGFHSEPREEIMPWKYTKLLANLGNAVEAICGRVPDAAEVVGPLRAEAEAVLAAAGIGHVSAELNRQRRGDLIRIRPVGGQDRGGGSTWQSLVRGTAVETDHLNGEIVLLGRLHGVPTPLNERIRQLANRHARQRIPPGALTAGQLLALLTAEAVGAAG